MTVVLDASAAVRVVTGHDEGDAFADTLLAADTVLVPDLFVAEVTNALWRLARFAGLGGDLASSSVRRALALPTEFLASQPIAPEVLAMALSHQRPAYDLFYFVLARRHAARLLTADRGLQEFARLQGIQVG